MGDALDVILESAKKAGVLEGLTPNLIEGLITHLKYADDTILFVTPTRENIVSLKFLLFCFEEMSGVKINYQKSEVFGVGLEEGELDEFADMLNCQKGEMPIVYLGLPVSTEKIGKRELFFVGQQMEKRLGTWIGGYVSYGGKEILINSYLSSIPLYAMGFYKLLEGVHKKMDSVRGRFYWQGMQKKKKKYHMMSWRAMSRPKDFGGLGFLETRKMNISLLAKWIFKLEHLFSKYIT